MEHTPISTRYIDDFKGFYIIDWVLFDPLNQRNHQIQREEIVAERANPSTYTNINHVVQMHSTLNILPNHYFKPKSIIATDHLLLIFHS